ncbi:hypothetical protein [uncultured Tyzzerella sp.]|uniref:hypothetical protein n=1 Tax=uncultured Tyzzerella sp. TaxID=2321398 RepID=UPI002943A5B9|nr:hypothetical protein [uncultured Tyzzerella sp.]
MIKLEIEEFIFEVKDEILSYEELGKEYADKWEQSFLAWLKDDKIKKKNIKIEKGNTYYLIDDESEIFDIADEYYYAVDGNKIEEYWKKFQ